MLLDSNVSNASNSDRLSPPDRDGDTPRIWPSLLAMPAALVGVTVFSGIIGTAAIVFVPGNRFAVLADGTPTAPLMILSIAAMQVGMLLCALTFALRSKEPIARRLNMARPKLSLSRLGVVVAGTLGIATIAGALLTNATDETSPHLVSLLEFVGAQRGWAMVATLIAVGLLPGLCEELLFRGYVQTRLVRRLGPVAGIVLAAALFAIMHLDPQHMVIAFMLGTWCGVVVWRTGSVWSGVACHALNNTFSTVATALLPVSMQDLDGAFSPWILGVQSVFLALLTVAIVILMRAGRSPSLTRLPSGLAVT